MLKVWRINYVKGGEITKLCDINDISPRLYHSAHKVKCNNCQKDATHLVKAQVDVGLSEPFPDVQFITDIPLCEEHHRTFTQ